MQHIVLHVVFPPRSLNRVSPCLYALSAFAVPGTGKAPIKIHAVSATLRRSMSLNAVTMASPMYGGLTTSILDRSVARYTAHLARITRDPTWMLLGLLQRSAYVGTDGKSTDIDIDKDRHGRREIFGGKDAASIHNMRLRHALARCKISMQDYTLWKPVIYAPDISTALSVLTKQHPRIIPSHLSQASDIGQNAPTQTPLPSWLLLHLVANKVRTATHARGVLPATVFQHLSLSQTRFSPAHRVPLLVFTASALAAFEILSPIRRVVDMFLEITKTMSTQNLEIHENHSGIQGVDDFRSIAVSCISPRVFPRLTVLHFNTILHAISALTRSPEATALALSVLEAMRARSIPLSSDAHTALLSTRFGTVELARYLLARGDENGKGGGSEPAPAQLEAYLRIFSRFGAVEEAGECVEAIRRHCVRNGMEAPVGLGDVVVSGRFGEKYAGISRGAQDRGKKIEKGSEMFEDGEMGSDREEQANAETQIYRQNTGSKGVVHPADTLYLSSLRNDRASAFAYLRNLLRHSRGGEKVDTNNIKSSIDGHVEAVRKATSDLHIPPHLSLSPPSPTLVSPRVRVRSRFWTQTKPGVDIYDWTALLHAAACDMTFSTARLVELFERAQKTRTYRATAATYTVVLRGLMWRVGRERGWPGQEMDNGKGRGTGGEGANDGRDPLEEALRLWDELVSGAVVLDRRALTVGVQLLTRAGRAPEAFYLLETFAGAGTGTDNGALQNSAPLVPLTSIAMNEYLVSLLRIRRPDVVFKLWEHMEALYGVLPDGATLEILLRAGILAGKMDNESVVGALRAIARQNPFRRASRRAGSEEREMSRAEVVSSISGMLGAGGGRADVGMWKEKPAVEAVRGVFREVMFGNWPWLADAVAPARAVRDRDLGGGPFYPLGEFARSMASSLGAEGRGGVAGELVAGPLADDAPYASVVPTNETFMAYVRLLGLFGRGGEIPEALAWMRGLGVAPSRKTLSVALVFFAEVGVRGPLFEAWAAGRGRSEYGRLEGWMREWVAPGRVPGEGDVREALKWVARMRDGCFV